MTKHVLEPFWVQRFIAYDCIHVGFSGGLDSTVLLHALANEPELVAKVHAVHINHGLSPQAATWQRHCQQFCQRISISCQILSIDFNRQANIEAEARQARYLAFAQLVKENHCLLTAHHQDDQAETVLLHLFRGAGIAGLRGMRETMAFSQGYLHRPLLSIPRAVLLAYANAYELHWIEDESNTDRHFSRNFLRHEVMPLLQTKWPSVTKNLVRTSELCDQAQANLDDLAELDCPTLKQNLKALSIKPLMHLSEARLLNVLRHWLQINSVRLPNYDTLKRLMYEVVQASCDANPEVCWDDWVIKRFRSQLLLHEKGLSFQANRVRWSDFPKSLILPGLGILSVQPILHGVKVNSCDQVEVRFRQGGEVFFWHGQTKSLKKLMQQWSIPPWMRSKIPLIYVNQQLAVVVGYAISDLFCSKHAKGWEVNYVDYQEKA